MSSYTLPDVAESEEAESEATDSIRNNGVEFAKPMQAGAGRAIYEDETGRRFVDSRPNDPMPDHPAWKHSRD